VEIVEDEGCECVVPGLTEFFLFGISGGIWQHRELTKPLKSSVGSRAAIALFAALRAPLLRALKKSQRFEPPATIYELADFARPVLSLCNSMGEGWLLTAEMSELICSGTPNIVCTQPFACLPNHVTGKGVIKELRRLYPKSNIVAVDYDPGASEVNQLNRIKLMIAVAKSNFAEQCAASAASLSPGFSSGFAPEKKTERLPGSVPGKTSEPATSAPAAMADATLSAPPPESAQTSP
jgi:predicted nucleotide-binding protein (sugar kinase/HSP70/actin superfamily)